MNFQSMLAQFEQDATDAASEKRPPKSSKADQKRKLDHVEIEERGDDRQKKQTDHIPRISDIHQLSIRISFLCIGAQKGGTSWLHKMLRRHPSMSLPDQKEVHFWDWNRRKGLGWYSDQFPRANDRKNGIAGEITPCYCVLQDRHVLEIRTLFPKVRIVFLARDLVERAWSAICMELWSTVRGVDAGTFSNDVDPRTTRQYDKESDPSNHPDDYFMDRLAHSTHRTRSDYCTALRKWLEHFPEEQLLILDYRDMGKDPKRVLGSICDHVGVGSDSFLESLGEEDLKERVNATVGSTVIRPSLRRKMECYLRPFAVEFNGLLSELGYQWRLDEYRPSTEEHVK